MLEIIGYTALIWVFHSWLMLINWNEKILKYLCLKCITFWVLLAITWNPFMSAIGALIAYIIDSKINEVRL